MNHEDGNAAGLHIEDLVRRYHAPIYRYAFRLAGTVAEAEDVTQQTFLLAQQKLHQVRDRNRVDRWLFAVARSCYLKGRQKKRPVAAATLELNLDQVPDVQWDADEIDREKLQQAIAALPDEFRVVVMMFYFEQLSYKEIAETLEMPVGTVMSRLSRAKGRLRGRLLRDAVPAEAASSTRTQG